MSFEHPYKVDDVRSVLRIGEMSPERLVAFESHQWMAAGMLAQSYEDPEVEVFVRRVEELLEADKAEMDALRRRWLSTDEYERVQAEIAEMGNPDYEW